MKNILGKVSALAVASLFAVGSFAGSVGAAGVSSYDRERAADIQRCEFAKYKKSRSYNSIKRDINENESDIRYYERNVRTSLDSKLSELLNKKEICEALLYNVYRYGGGSDIRSKLRKINNEIGDVRHKIRRNESKIGDLKRRRERLNEELAILIQIQEDNYKYNRNDNCNYNRNENCNNNENY